MKTACLTVLITIALASRAKCETANDFLFAHYPFDGSLSDVSGKEHHAAGEAKQFAEGKEGQALKLDWQTLEVPSSPDLQLSPGFTIDCWVYFDEKPTGYQPFVIKEKEYQLRLDDQREGGEFAFFVYLDGWEPRIRATVPVAGKWYHLVAKWTGAEISLSVNGERVSGERFGTPKPTDNPVHLGKANCRIDEVKLYNPGLAKTRRMQEMIRRSGDGERRTRGDFGGAAGWEGWRGAFGGDAVKRDEALTAQFPDEHAMLLNPALDIEAGQNTWVSVHLRSQKTTRASLTFVTEAGSGVASLPVWDYDRTCTVNLASHPAWRGKLKLLGLSFPSDGANEATIGGVWVSGKPEGKPFLYVRNLAPTRAVLRAGRDEKIIAVVRNLGTEVEELRVELRVPEGVRLVGEAVKRLETVPHNATERFEWTVRAEAPVVGEAEVAVTQGRPVGQRQGDRSGDRSPALPARRGSPDRAALTLRFEPALPGPKAAYVPPPRPAKSKYLALMHYCPLWKVGTHYGWEKIEPWPERKPAIGWYDEGTPEVADWHIKYALEHGIQGFIYCWYRADFSHEIHQMLGHAVHDGLLKAKYRDQFKFAIMWENGCAKGVKDRDDLMDNVLPYWMENYFTHPSYVVIDNKPLLIVWRPERVAPELGGSEVTREVFDEMRAVCRKRGFDGLWIVGCVETANEGLLKRLADEGWDATTAYATWSHPTEEPAIDIEGITTQSNRAHVLAEKDTWLGKKAVGALPDIVSVMQGWDPRPWHGAKIRAYWADASPDHFRVACEEAKRIIDATPGNGLDKRLVVFDNWDEFGEGHYIEPTVGFGFQYVDVIRDVFCQETEPCQHVIPEDVGLEPPQRWYERQREILGVGRRVTRKVVDNLVAWWSFDEDNDYLAHDSSQCHFDGAKQDVKLTDGVRGKAMLCDGGTLALGSHELLFPSKGLTVELWLKTDVPDQADRWILNVVGAANTGYRLGMVGGKLGWQIPQEPWSHLVADPDPVPLGKWIHVAATYDGKTMRLFVDGKQKASAERLGAIHPSGGKLTLGSYGQGDRRHNFIGAIDEVRLHDRVLAAHEIAKRLDEVALP